MHKNNINNSDKKVAVKEDKMSFAKSFKSMSELAKDINNAGNKNMRLLKSDKKSDKQETDKNSISKIKLSPAEVKEKNNEMFSK
jgi:hypothetical protein